MFPLILVWDRVIRREELLLLNTTFSRLEEAIKIRHTVNLITACQGKRHIVIWNLYINCKIRTVSVMAKYGEKPLRGNSLQPAFLSHFSGCLTGHESRFCFMLQWFLLLCHLLWPIHFFGSGSQSANLKSNLPGSSLPARFSSIGFQRQRKTRQGPGMAF